MGRSSPRPSRGRSHRSTEAFAKTAGVPASPRRGSPGVREHAWSHLENRRRPARSRDWTTDRLVASVFAPARRRAWIRPRHERVFECFALPDRSHRREMEIERSSHGGSSRCVKLGEPCALWTSSVRKRTTSRAISHSAGPDDERASRKWATRRCLPTVCESGSVFALRSWTWEVDR